MIEYNIYNATAIGFEPMREYPSGFLVHHLNHSVKQPEALWAIRTPDLTLTKRML